MTNPKSRSLFVPAAQQSTEEICTSIARGGKAGRATSGH